jgi:hypothetical protein
VAIIALSFGFVGCDDGKDEKQTPVVDDFNISGIGEFDYDGTAKTVNIAPKPNKSTGSITVYYNGSVTAPIEINSYSVTFDVAEAEGFNAKNGLVAGTLVIGGPNVNGIPVVGIDGFEVTDAHIAAIIAAFDDMKENGAPSQAAYMENNVKEFRIFSGNDSTWVGIEDGKLIVKISSQEINSPYAAIRISGKIYDYAMSKAVSVVDATGRLVGTCLNGNIITSNNYSFLIMLTGELAYLNFVYASEENGKGTLYGKNQWYASYPNLVIRLGLENEYYRVKNRDAEGYPTTIIPSVSHQSSYNHPSWSNYSSQATDVVELEKIAGATDISYFIGFTPTMPIEFKF